jgi:hypothetical protein
VVSQRAEAAVEDPFATPESATSRAGGALGSTTNPGNEFGQKHGLCPSGWRLVSYRCPRVQAVSFKYSGGYAPAPEKLGGDGREVSFPGYAPELNPDEMVWGYTKYQAMANYAPADIWELRLRLIAELVHLQLRPDLLRAFIKHTGLPLRL